MMFDMLQEEALTVNTVSLLSGSTVWLLENSLFFLCKNKWMRKKKKLIKSVLGQFCTVRLHWAGVSLSWWDNCFGMNHAPAVGSSLDLLTCSPACYYCDCPSYHSCTVQNSGLKQLHSFHSFQQRDDENYVWHSTVVVRSQLPWQDVYESLSCKHPLYTAVDLVLMQHRGEDTIDTVSHNYKPWYKKAPVWHFIS